MAAHRYWRIDNWVVSSGLLELCEAHVFAAGVDQTTSATYSSARAMDFGSLADWKDSNTLTKAYWNGTPGTMKLNIDFGLGVTKSINGVKLAGFDASNRYPTSFDLSYSDDASSYTVLGSASSLTYPGDQTYSSLISLGPDVTLQLSSSAITCSVGSLGRTKTKALTGNLITSTIANLRPPLGGIASTLSVGSVGKAARTKAITGNAITSAKGNIGTGRGITKVSITTGAGSVALGAHRVALTSATATGSRGTLTPHSTVSCVLTGSVVTITPGTPRPVKAKLLTGSAATTAVGTVRKGAGLTKVTSTTAVGSVTRGRAVALIGVSTALSIGSVGGTRPKIPTITVTSRPVSRVLVGS